MLEAVAYGGVDLQDDDGFRADFGSEVAYGAPEDGEGVGPQGARGVDEHGDRMDAVGVDGWEIEAGIDEAAVGPRPGVVGPAGVDHVSAERGLPVDEVAVGIVDGLGEGAGQFALGLGEVERLMERLVPVLLFFGEVGSVRGVAGIVGGGRVHDLAGAGRIGAVVGRVPVRGVLVRIRRVIGGGL